jgi:two-component system cell cycle response regulator
MARSPTIALIDLDDFGKINKENRWTTGDRALRHIVETANGNIRLLDWLARYAGEEFCLVMPDTSLRTGCSVAERIRWQIDGALAHTSAPGFERRLVRALLCGSDASITEP